MKGWTIFWVGLVLYGVSVFGGFVQDDLRVIAGDADMGKPSALAAAWMRPYYYVDGTKAGAYRPLTSFSFYANALITGAKPWGFHLVNVLMYGGVCILVLKLLEKLKVGQAFWWTVLFVVLPIHTEAVNNIVGRAEMLSLGLLLGAILLQFEKKWEMSALVFLLALLTKETAIVGLPVLLFLITKEKETKETKIGLGMFYVLVAGLFLGLRMMVLGSNGMASMATMVENPLKFAAVGDRVRTAFGLVSLGLEKTLFPLYLSYDYSFNQIPVMASWLNGRVMLGVMLMILSLVSLMTGLRKNKIWILGQALFWGPIAVTGNFLFSVGTIFGERLWFWSSLGVILLLSVIFDDLKYTKYPYSTPSPSTGRPRSVRYFGTSAPMFLLIVMITLYGGRAFLRNLDWLSQERLFLRDASYVKQSVMAQSNAAAMYLIRGDWEGGKKFMEKADKIFPKYPELLNNWGMYYLWKGDTVKAKAKFEECLVERPEYYLCTKNLESLE